MPNKWDDIANDAANATDAIFADKITSLTRLNSDDIQKLLDTGISKQDLAKVLSVVKDATKNNQDKAKAIQNISKGLDALVAIAGKFI